MLKLIFKDSFCIKSIFFYKVSFTHTQTLQVYCLVLSCKHVEHFRVGHIRFFVFQNSVQPGVHAAQDQIEPGEGELRGSPVLRVGVRQRFLLLLLRSLLPAELGVGSGCDMRCDAACV